jgi:hypothetical protein
VSLLRGAFALAVCAAALLLPYRARAALNAGLAALFHAPFLLFGRLARRLLSELERPA